MRLKGHRCFDHLHRSGVRYQGPSMVLKVAKANPKLIRSHKRDQNPTACKCAVAISNKVSKKAVVRNRLRRLFHQHLRLRLSSEPQRGNNWALISLKPNSSKKELNPLLEECDKLLREAGLVK